jgi:hypothetical protein
MYLLVLEGRALLHEPGVEVVDRPVGHRARGNLRGYLLRAPAR